MKLQDLLLVADCNYHVFFKTDMADISGLPYTEIKKRRIKRLSKHDSVTRGSGMEHYNWMEVIK